VQNFTTNKPISSLALTADLSRLFVKLGLSGFQVYTFVGGAYKLNQTISQNLTDDRALTTANGSTVAFGQDIFMLSGSNYTKLQTVEEIDDAAISANGLVYAGILETQLKIWNRPDCFTPFILFQNLTLPKYMTSLEISANGSKIAVTTPTTVFIFEKTSTYKQVLSFPTGMSLKEVLSPGVHALPDFSVLFVTAASVDNNFTINIFRPKGSDYTLSQTLTSQAAVLYALTASEDILVYQQTSLMRIFQDFTKYFETDNLRQNYESLNIKNGTLVASVGQTVIIWRNGTKQMLGLN